MKDLIVVGAATPHIVKLIHAINRESPTQWRLKGFVDDDPTKHGTTLHGYPVLGSLDLLQDGRYAEAFCVCFLYGGTIHTRMKVLDRLNTIGVSYATLVHPGVDTSYTEIGDDCVIQGGTWLQDGVRIGNHVAIGFGCLIAHGVILEDYVWVASHVTVLGRAQVKRGATLGAGSVIKGDLTIGEEALVGMGSVVIQDVPDRVTVFGNPARIINRSGIQTRNPF